MSAVEDDGGARVRVSGDVLMRFTDGIRNRRVNEKVYVLINSYITFIQSGKQAEAPAALRLMSGLRPWHGGSNLLEIRGPKYKNQ